MAAVMHLDTHVVLWLYAGMVERFPSAAVARIEGSALLVSPTVALELHFLQDVGRLGHEPAAVIEDLQRRVGLDVASDRFPAVVKAAAAMTWTRDPFDRLIAGQAAAAEVPLLTANRRIRKNLDLAVWER